MSDRPGESSGLPQDSERRSFLTGLSAIGAGTLVAIFPFAAGWRTFSSPLQGNNGGGDAENADADFVRVCSLDALPADGTPQAFPVVADVTDAWTRTVGQRIGEVFLSRSDEGGKPKVTAFTATCPHLGCAVEFDAAESRYACPCHESGFSKDGKKLFGPSLRGLDPLEVTLVGDDGARQVWVRFDRFKAGIAEREPIA